MPCARLSTCTWPRALPRFWNNIRILRVALVASAGVILAGRLRRAISRLSLPLGWLLALAARSHAAILFVDGVAQPAAMPLGFSFASRGGAVPAFGTSGQRAAGPGGELLVDALPTLPAAAGSAIVAARVHTCFSLGHGLVGHSSSQALHAPLRVCITPSQSGTQSVHGLHDEVAIGLRIISAEALSARASRGGRDGGGGWCIPIGGGAGSGPRVARGGVLVHATAVPEDIGLRHLGVVGNGWRPLAAAAIFQIRDVVVGHALPFAALQRESAGARGLEAAVHSRGGGGSVDRSPHPLDGVKSLSDGGTLAGEVGAVPCLLK